MSTAESVFGTLAQQDQQRQAHDQSVQQQAQSGAEGIFGHMAANNGQPPLQPTQPQQQEPPGFGQRAYEVSGLKGIIDTAKQHWQDSQAKAAEEQKMAESAMKALEQKNYGQAAELLLSHLAKNVKESSMGALTGGPIPGMAKNLVEGEFESAKQHAGKAVIQAAKGHYGTAALEGAGAISGASNNPVIEDIEKKNVRGLAGDVVGAGAQGLAALAGGEFAPEGAAAAEGAEAETPGLLKQAIKGKSVAQQPAKEAIRATVGADEDATLLEGHKTVLDEHLQGIASKEKEAYAKQDKAAGFDVKETRAKLKDAEYKVKQPEIDDAMRGRLQKTIDESKKSIGEAEDRFKQQGVDVKEADTLHKQRMAGQEFKKVLVRNLSPDGESVNVDGLLKASKNLRVMSKYGDRLEQYLGKEGADSFMEKLQEAQEMGAHAMKVQQVSKWLAGAAGLGAIGGAAHHLVQ